MNDTLTRTVDIYHKALLNCPEALKMAESLGLNQACIEQYQIGYCDGSLSEMVGKTPQANELTSLGILHEGQDKLCGCITVPVTHSGRTLTICGIRTATDRPSFPRGLPVPLWGLDALERHTSVLAVSNLKDALRLVGLGYDNVIALCGTDCAEELDVKVKKVTFIAASSRGHSDAPDRFPVIFPPQVQASTDLITLDMPSVKAYIDKLGESRLRKLLLTAGQADDDDGVIYVKCAGRCYEVTGVVRKGRKLNATVRLEHGEPLHIVSFNLYSATGKRSWVRDMTNTFSLSKHIVEGDYAAIVKACENQCSVNSTSEDLSEELSDEERDRALKFSRSKSLVEQILQDYQVLGVVGEKENCLLSYIAMTSRKTEHPINLLLTSSSGLGKSTVQKTTSSLCPANDLINISSLTGKALSYIRDRSLKHKLIAIDEFDGAVQASQQLRVLMSEGSLTSLSTQQDRNGRLVAELNTVNGPVAIQTTTTRHDIDIELRNRFFISTLDESPEQTRKVMEEICRHYGTGMKVNREDIIKRHHHFQSVLEPCRVIIPNPERLLLDGVKGQFRRMQANYLRLVTAVAFLRQHQHETKCDDTGDYIEADDVDIAIARRVADHVLQHSTDDLSPQARSLLTIIQKSGRTMFEAKDIDDITAQGRSWVRKYLREMVENDYLLIIRPKPYKYQLL